MVGDELGEKVVSVGFRASGKLSAAVLKKLFGLILKGGDKILYHTTSNKESIHKLSQDGHQTQGVEVEKSQMCGFDKYAKKYHFEYSLIREKNDKSQYFLTFKAKDISKMDMAMQDFLKDKTVDRGDLQERIEKAKTQAFNINQAKEKIKEHTKSHGKNRNVER
jgi:hypothetical protein